MYILKDNREVVIRTSLRHITEEKNQSDIESETKLIFDTHIKSRLGDVLRDEYFLEYVAPIFTLI